MATASPQFKAFSDFIQASRNQPQSTIIKEFLATIINGRHICESGSVLVYRAPKKLVLFNEDNFLIEQGFLEEGRPWSKEFDVYDGSAGKAFRFKEVQVVNDAQRNRDFSTRDGEVPIAHMVCAPIPFSKSKSKNGAPPPFGVACFHNADAKRRFSEDDVCLIKAYTDVLGMALEYSQQTLDWEKNKRIFIVHGHDRVPLIELKHILLSRQLEPQIAAEKVKTGQELLEMLEGLINSCRGGFVLLTPDDVGRVVGGSKLSRRARQNVIFESGMLTALFRASKNVCFLVKQPEKGKLELPSDMHGLLTQEIGSPLNEKLVDGVLAEWGISLPS